MIFVENNEQLIPKQRDAPAEAMSMLGRLGIKRSEPLVGVHDSPSARARFVGVFEADDTCEEDGLLFEIIIKN